ncbi:MAG: hypothetical protein F6K41_15570 [Symploca sp. SIO3E6]|nr:hypothetical protein [Caldora sp. SIO3E6]
MEEMSQQKFGEISVAGKTVPIYAKGQNGQMFVPNEIAREIVLDFLGRAIATPVTAITIVVGGAWRDIRLTYETVAQDIDVEVHRIRMETELRKVQNTFHMFASKISSVSNADYPEELKRIQVEDLKNRMQEQLRKIKN